MIQAAAWEARVLFELLLATVLVVTTVFIHGWGIVALGWMVRGEREEEEARHIVWGSARSMAFTVGIALGLFTLHALEIWLYAAAYHEIGAIDDLRHAIFFSTSAYAAVGYGENLIAEHWRLVAAIESINGIILIGWTTAFFVTVMGRFQHERRRRR